MKVLVIIDMQNDFITGSLGSKEAEVAAKNLCRWIKKNITKNDRVIFTRDTHFKDYFDSQEGKKLPISHCIIGLDGWGIYPDLKDTVMKAVRMISYEDKETFGTTSLASCLPVFRKNVDEIIFAGLMTDVCLVSNALILKAQEPEIPMKVLANCCAGTTPEKHEAALSVMESCQIEVVR